MNYSATLSNLHFTGVRLVITCALVLILGSVQAQLEGTISYIETIKIDIDIEGIDESMLAMIPKSQDLKKKLVFNQKETLYTSRKGEILEDTELESDDGSVKIMIMHDDTEELLYHSLGDKKQIHQKGIMGRSFIVEDDIEKHKWKMTNEKIKYLDYECTKAIIETKDEFIVAWFTSEIPLQIGPSGFGGLPGAVLMVNVNEGELEIKATEVELHPLDKDAITIPEEGKKVTEEEYKKIRAEKEKEMQEAMNQGEH